MEFKIPFSGADMKVGKNVSKVHHLFLQCNRSVQIESNVIQANSTELLANLPRLEQLNFEERLELFVISKSSRVSPDRLKELLRVNCRFSGSVYLRVSQPRKRAGVLTKGQRK